MVAPVISTVIFTAHSTRISPEHVPQVHTYSEQWNQAHLGERPGPHAPV